MSATTHRALRLALASLLFVALVAQLAIGMSRASLTMINFFSFFTILSNTMAVVLLSLLAARSGLTTAEWFPLFRGAVTVYMSVTGLVYALVLAPTNIDVGLTEPWVNWSLHVFGPLGVLLDWVYARPESQLPRNAPLLWLGFPAAYLVYTLVRGALVDWYPYPFLDPSQTGGYRGVALWSVAVLVIILAFSVAIHWWSNRDRGVPVTA
ncbi:MAG TPA: Pr6Pr family membrane protein [Acidimicrobiia bacterium]|nr:Pr6Pr family membrane protein [Acidimicrobiia bacterium]